MANLVKIPVSFQYEATVYVATTSGGAVTNSMTAMLPAAGVSVAVVDTDTSSPATVYADSAASSTLVSITTDAGGNVPGWIAEGSYQITASASGSFGGDTVYWQAVRGDGVSRIASGVVGASQIASGAVTLAKLANAVAQALVPVGTVLPYAGTTAPTGFVFTDGSVYSQTGTYANLYAVCGSNFNTGGEGAGNFRVPDTRQRFILGKAASGTGSSVGGTGGHIDHTHGVQLTVSDFTVNGHDFSVVIGNHHHGLSNNGGASFFIDKGYNAPAGTEFDVALNIYGDFSGPSNAFAGYRVQGVDLPQYQWVASAITQPTLALHGQTDDAGGVTYSGTTSSKNVSGVLTAHEQSDAENPPYLVLRHIIKY